MFFLQLSACQFLPRFCDPKTPCAFAKILDNAYTRRQLTHAFLPQGLTHPNPEYFTLGQDISKETLEGPSTKYTLKSGEVLNVEFDLCSLSPHKEMNERYKGVSNPIIINIFSSEFERFFYRECKMSHCTIYYYNLRFFKPVASLEKPRKKEWLDFFKNAEKKTDEFRTRGLSLGVQMAYSQLEFNKMSSADREDYLDYLGLSMLFFGNITIPPNHF